MFFDVVYTILKPCQPRLTGFFVFHSHKFMQTPKLKLAIQKSGRLTEKSTELLKQCGIQLSNGVRLRDEAANFPLEVLYLRDDDIPQYVHEGVAHIGIAGLNVVQEKGLAVRTLMPLGYGRCRLSIAVRREVPYNGVTSLQGTAIATSYPRVTERYLKEKGVDARIEFISGSVEIAPGIGLADAICDLVSTGSTLLANGLREAEVILRSEAILIANNDLDPSLQAITDRLLFRIQAVQNAARHKYILLNAPNERLDNIAALLPGVNSPTVMPLARPGWSSLHSVVAEDEFWEVIDRLRDAGAEGILVCPIEKMIR